MLTLMIAVAMALASDVSGTNHASNARSESDRNSSACGRNSALSPIAASELNGIASHQASTHTASQRRNEPRVSSSERFTLSPIEPSSTTYAEGATANL